MVVHRFAGCTWQVVASRVRSIQHHAVGHAIATPQIEIGEHAIIADVLVGEGGALGRSLVPLHSVVADLPPRWEDLGERELLVAIHHTGVGEFHHGHEVHALLDPCEVYRIPAHVGIGHVHGQASCTGLFLASQRHTCAHIAQVDARLTRIGDGHRGLAIGRGQIYAADGFLRELVRGLAFERHLVGDAFLQFVLLGEVRGRHQPEGGGLCAIPSFATQFLGDTLDHACGFRGLAHGHQRFGDDGFITQPTSIGEALFRIGLYRSGYPFHQALGRILLADLGISCGEHPSAHDGQIALFAQPVHGSEFRMVGQHQGVKSVSLCELGGFA